MNKEELLSKQFATIYDNAHCCIHLPEKKYCSVKSEGISFSGDLNKLKVVLQVRNIKRIPIIDITGLNVKDIMNRNYHLGERLN